MPEAENVWTDIPPVYYAENAAEHATAALSNHFKYDKARITRLCLVYLEDDIAEMRNATA